MFPYSFNSSSLLQTLFLFNNFKIGFSKSKLCKEKLIDVDENS